MKETKPLYIVAVSGGVDSVVMLHRLVQDGSAELVVAHVDHGMRLDSGSDAQFVRELAQRYGLEYVSRQLHLRPDASENTARLARWKFLRQVKEQYRADAILTAHHADDAVETMIINLLRGTGWRGLASLRETDEVKRPLLDERKRAIIIYAQEYGLAWREDATNEDTTYLRNYVRHKLIPRCSDGQFKQFLALSREQRKLREMVEAELETMSVSLRRYDFVMWPDSVARETMRKLFGSLTRPESDRTLLFIRTAASGKQLVLTTGAQLKMTVNRLIVIETED